MSKKPDITSDVYRCRLYIITPPALDPLIFSATMAKALDAGDVAAFQLRLDKASNDDWLRAIDMLMPIAHERDVAFIVNDRADLAKKMDTDGVHLGMQDMNIKDARQMLGAEKIIGASCIDSKHSAMTAAERGASYVSFGPFYQSRSPFYPPSVLDAQNMVSPDLVRWWSDIMEVPVVAAGGIKPANCAELVKAGADFICASTAIWEHSHGAHAAVRAFNDEIARAQES